MFISIERLLYVFIQWYSKVALYLNTNVDRGFFCVCLC